MAQQPIQPELDVTVASPKARVEQAKIYGGHAHSSNLQRRTLSDPVLLTNELDSSTITINKTTLKLNTK